MEYTLVVDNNQLDMISDNNVPDNIYHHPHINHYNRGPFIVTQEILFSSKTTIY